MSSRFDWHAVSDGAPYITLSALGLALNHTAIVKLGSPEKVNIGFIEETRTIGVRASAQDTTIPEYKIAGKENSGWVRIGCKYFIEYLESLTGLSFTPAIRYVARYDTRESALIIEVSEMSS